MTTTTAKPTKFWINSMGEFGRNYDDGDEQMVGSINTTELARTIGRTPTQDDLDDAFQRQEWAFYINDAEPALHAAFKHLADGSLSNAAFRFYAGIDYTATPAVPSLLLSVEYQALESDTEFFDGLRVIANEFGALDNDGDPLEDMFTHQRSGHWTHYGTPEQQYHPTEHDGENDWQVAVNFDVLGKSYGEVATLQLRWSLATAHLADSRVGVL